MPEFFAKSSGKKVVVNLAPWPDAKRLKSAIERELANAGIVLGKEMPVMPLMEAMLKIDSSEAVDAALQPCLARCTYDNQKITDATWTPAEARSDYYEVIVCCILENCRPLFESLLSVLPQSLRDLVKARTQAASDPVTK